MLNGMLSNISKCNVFSFSRAQTVQLHSYQMGATEIDRVNVIRDLGVLIDNKVRFNEHITSVAVTA